jgi:hypothetical protein
MRPTAVHLAVAAAIAAAIPVAAQHPERRGIGLQAPKGVAKVRGASVRSLETAAARTSLAAKFDARRSLFVTDVPIVEKFTLQEVMARLAAAEPSLTPKALFHRWWSTADEPWCGQTFNGFPFTCPRPEASEATNQDPFGTGIDGYSAIALSNRFDLASLPGTGSDCGEYRIVFARNSGSTKPNSTARNLLIFEAVLPNPKPGKDLSGCAPIQEMWARLSEEDDVQKRAKTLRDFYFDGIPSAGVAPVVKAEHYGAATPTAKGQIRTNQFLNVPNFIWNLREFRVVVAKQRVDILQDTVKSNPHGEQFSATSSNFATNFLTAIPQLTGAIDAFSLSMDDKFNSGQSPDLATSNYVEQAKDNSALLDAVAKKLATSGGADLKPLQAIARAQAMSCMGCHQQSNGADIGPGERWPSSLGFVHQSEFDPELVGGIKRFRISDALVKVFLPARERIVKEFLKLQ